MRFHGKSGGQIAGWSFSASWLPAPGLGLVGTGVLLTIPGAGFFDKLLTSANPIGYPDLAAGIPAVGFESPETKADVINRLNSDCLAVFAFATWLCFFWAGYVGGESLPVPWFRSLNPHSPAHFAFESAWVENFFSNQGARP